MSTSKKNNFIGSIFAKNSWLLAGFLIAAIAVNIIVVYGNDCISNAIDKLTSGDNVNIFLLLKQVVILIIIGAIVEYARSYMKNLFGVKVIKEIREKIAQHILDLPDRFYNQETIGSLINKGVSDVEEVGRFFAEIFPNFLMNFMTVFVIAVYFGNINLLLLIALLASYPLMLIAADKLSKKLAKVAKSRRSQMDKRTDVIYDAIQGIEIVKSFGLYDVIKDNVYNIIDKIAEHGCESTKITSLGYFYKSVMTTVPLIFCYLVALKEVLDGSISAGDIFVYIALLGRITYPLSELVFSANDFKLANVSIERLRTIYNYEVEQGGKYSQNEEQDNIVSWENVSFSYSGDKTVLDNVSFELNKGDKIAIVGGSGEGKTTIFHLLCGLYPIQKGSYKLLGHEFADWDLNSARNYFSVVSQNIFLFPKTIYENVTLGLESPSREEVVQACKFACIHEFIMTLPQQYNTMVGERGVLLSGGERQRIALARAFLKNAPILLLDEPTSALDIDTEERVKRNIANYLNNKTTITIAHRLSTIIDADRILVLQHGRIVEQGTHDELLKQNGVYFDLYRKELEDEEQK